MPNFFGMPVEEVFQTNDVFIQNLRKSALTQNLTIVPDIDLVLVLSERSTVLGGDADHLDRAFDLERIREGIRIATQVNALKAGKDPEHLNPEEFITPILYNGRTIHNEHLRTALAQGGISYPEALFIILDVNPENTIDQDQSLKKYLDLYQHRNIAVVSSDYDTPRVARIIEIEDDVFIQNLRKSALIQNPTIVPDIDLVVVLSGRSTVLGGDADRLKRPFDTSDDLERMREGIRIATQVNALRAGKDPEHLNPEDFVTPILYNGRAIHNKHLRAALDQGLIAYPKALFIILDISPETTIGQVQSLKKYLALYQHKNVAVVSNAYHIPRIARTIGNDSAQTDIDEMGEHPIRSLSLFLFGVHKHEKRNGIVYDLQGEHQAMMNYSRGEKASIARYQSRNTFFCDEDYRVANSFKRAKTWDNIAIPPVLTTCDLSNKQREVIGQIRLLERPEHIEQNAARTILVESFIGEYEKYLSPNDIDLKLTSWRDGENSVAAYYEEYFKTEFGDFLSGKFDYWVEARVDGKLAGWATFEREESHHNSAVYMNLLVVHPKYQGLSIGSSLVASLMNLKLIPDLEAIHLLLRKKNTGGRVFYSKLGFESDPGYVRADNFVDLNLLEALTWTNPALQHVEQMERTQSHMSLM